MKKTLLIILFLSGMNFYLKAQLSVSGLPLASNINGIYYAVTVCPVPTDAGSPMYAKANFFYVIRQGGKWKIMDLVPDGGTTYITTIKLINTTSINPFFPNCSDVWQEWTGLEYSDVIVPPVPFTSTGISYQISMTSSSNQCISPCMPQGPITWSKVVDLPIINEADRNNITIAEGLRAGSLLWNCTTRKVNVYDGCVWKNLKTTAANSTTLNSASIGYTMAIQGASFSWSTNLPAAQIFSFKIQYSLNNEEWVDYKTFPPTVFLDNSPTNFLFVFHNTYKFRVVTTTTCGDEHYSCSLSSKVTTPINFLGLFRTNLSEFDLGSALQVEYTEWAFSPTPTTLNSLTIILEKLNGNTWVNVQTNTLASITLPYYYVIPYSTYVLGGKYRIRSNYGSYNTSHQFSYKKIQPLCFDNE